jgi:hypothetical protein
MLNSETTEKEPARRRRYDGNRDCKVPIGRLALPGCGAVLCTRCEGVGAAEVLADFRDAENF